MDICKIKPSDDDVERRDQLDESVLQFNDRLQKNLPAETEEYLDYLANPSAEQDDTNTAVKCPTIKTETLPSKRLTDSSFIRNLPESCNVETSKHYHHVSQLYSNDIFQVKAFVDSIMNEYGLFEWSYLPKPECHPPTPSVC